MYSGASSLSKCCTLTEDAACDIILAIGAGNGKQLKELLSPYHATCVNHMEVSKLLSIIACVYLMRQIGIARILATEYGVDFNGLNEKGEPDFFCFLMDVIPLNHVSH